MLISWKYHKDVTQKHFKQGIHGTISKIKFLLHNFGKDNILKKILQIGFDVLIWPEQSLKMTVSLKR